MMASMRRFTHFWSGAKPSSRARPWAVSAVARLRWDEGLGAHAEGEADDARQPLVVIVLERRRLRRLVLHVAGDEAHAAPLAELAREERVPIGLELADLVDGPARRHADERLGHAALGVVAELEHRAAERDVDAHHHLLHRREAVDLVGAQVARRVDELVG